MILILIFLGFFALGVVRARRVGANVADQLRYGLTHGLPAVLIVYAIATIGDWQGIFN